MRVASSSASARRELPAGASSSTSTPSRPSAVGPGVRACAVTAAAVRRSVEADPAPDPQHLTGVDQVRVLDLVAVLLVQLLPRDRVVLGGQPARDGRERVTPPDDVQVEVDVRLGIILLILALSVNAAVYGLRTIQLCSPCARWIMWSRIFWLRHSTLRPMRCFVSPMSICQYQLSSSTSAYVYGLLKNAS